VQISPSTPKLAQISEGFDMTRQATPRFSEEPFVLEGRVPAVRGWIRLTGCHLP
jgi:hypothetical protein